MPDNGLLVVDRRDGKQGLWMHQEKQQEHRGSQGILVCQRQGHPRWDGA
jgi:hypothetical protein